MIFTKSKNSCLLAWTFASSPESLKNQLVSGRWRIAVTMRMARCLSIFIHYVSWRCNLRCNCLYCCDACVQCLVVFAWRQNLLIDKYNRTGVCQKTFCVELCVRLSVRPLWIILLLFSIISWTLITNNLSEMHFQPAVNTCNTNQM